MNVQNKLYLRPRYGNIAIEIVIIARMPERVDILLNLSIFNWKCEKIQMFHFKLRTDLLRPLLHPKTAHRHYVKQENTS